MRPDGSAARSACLAAATWLAAGCASPGGGWFQFGPHPAALAGIWIASAKATPTDTVAWVLAPNGEDLTLVVYVRPATTAASAVTRRETRYGFWYLSGALGDAMRQAICVKRRARDGAACAPFRLDTIPAAAGVPARRRLRVLGSRGDHHTRDRGLLER